MTHVLFFRERGLRELDMNLDVDIGTCLVLDYRYGSFHPK